MEYRFLGKTGVEVSALCLGTFSFGFLTPPEDAEEMLKQAIDAGINIIDTADSYSNGESEAIIGNFLSQSGLRDKVLIITKVSYPLESGPNASGLGRSHFVRACDASLRRLRTSHIDFYLINRPAGQRIAIEETLGALSDLVRSGKVRYVGCSTHPAWQVMEALMVSEIGGYAKYVVESPPYNLLDRRPSVST